MAPRPLLALGLVMVVATLGCASEVRLEDGSGGASTATVTSSTSAVGQVTHAASSSTGREGGLEITLDQLQFMTDCKPRVDDDPVQGSFEVTYVNHGSTTLSLAVEDPVVLTTVTASGPWTWSFSVEPAGPSLLEAGATRTVTYEKVAFSGTGQPSGLLPCDACSSEASLHVTFSNGETRSSDLEYGLACGF